MLDSQKRIQEIDASNMLGIISKFSKLIESGNKSVRSLDLEIKDCANGIVFLGLGGSAIGGDLTRDWLGGDIPGGVRIERGFDLTSPVDKDSVLICCSYSGNTWETLSLLKDAMKSRPKNLVIISSDGELKKIADKKKLPIINLDPGMPPRTTLASIISSMAAITDSIGWTKKASSEILAASASCGTFIKKELIPTIPEADNTAKQLAHQLHGYIPVVIGPNSMESVARRWKTQMNENAKQHCFFGTFPEISHNEIVPWKRDSRSNIFVPIFLRGSGLNEDMSRGFDRFHQTIQDCVKSIVIAPRGRNKIEMLLSHILIADFTSAYSAILSEVDPTPVDDILAFKLKK